MPLEFKTIQEKEAEIIADVETSTGQTVPTEEIAFDRINARSIAGMSKLGDMSTVVALRDVWASTTEDETVLGEYAEYTDTERTPSTQTKLNVSGTGVAAQTIPGGINGVQYVSADGQKFYFENDYEIPVGGIVDTDLTAFLPGPQANIQPGLGDDSILSITAQNSNISDKLTIQAVSVAGTDQETIEQWRTEIKRVMRRPVIADNGSYYHKMARERPNMVAGYAYVNRPGSMELYIESDAEDGVPTASQMVDMENYFRGNVDEVVRLQPRLEMFMPDGFTPRFVVRASYRSTLVVTVLGLSPDTTENREAVASDITTWFTTRKPYIKGVSISNNGIIATTGIGAVVQSTIESVGADSYSSILLEDFIGGEAY